jgi:alanine dehydrogenase
MKILDENAVRGLLEMNELIPAMASALADLSSGKAVQPVRTILPGDDHKGFFGVMPAYNDALGAKIVTFYPENKGVYTHHGLILLFRPETGEPIAVMDGRLITEMRTAAVSAAATDLLARRDTLVLEALRLVREFSEVRVWSPVNAGLFAEKHGIKAVVSAEEAVRGADVVVVATGAKSPVLFGKWISPGTHINAIGANRPTWRELDDEILEISKIFVESRAAAAVESGDLLAGGKIFAEIGEVVTRSKPGRESKDEITLFKSLGCAVEDIAAADLVYKKAAQMA